MAPPETAPWAWILGLTFITSFTAAFGNGANDVANSYATSVAARTLKMWHVGILSVFTEFIGALALGARVTDTIKNGIIAPDNFEGNPAVFMLVMSCAEFGNAVWLMSATALSMPVSTTQTIVGAIVGAGIATNTPVTWGWESGSVSQIAASWVIAPAISAGFSAILFASIKYAILNKGENSFKWALRLIPFYLALTGAVLALFIVVEAPTAPSLEEFGAGPAVGIVLGVFFGVLLVAFVFFKPYFWRRLVKQDARIRAHHIPMGPLLYMENPPLYWPAKGDKFVEDYYADAYGNHMAGTADEEKRQLEKHNNRAPAPRKGSQTQSQPGETVAASQAMGRRTSSSDATLPGDRPGPSADASDAEQQYASALERDIELNGRAPPAQKKGIISPYDRFITPVKHYSWANPRRWWGYLKFALLRGVTMDVITHDSALLRSIHAKANRYDDRIEHMWTYCQVASAMLSSISHGANDVANAIGPLVAVLATYNSGEVETESPTPIWILAIAGLMLGLGFWFFGYNIMRAVGNRITQFSPTRGFAVELGSAVTVLLASRLGLPVSTTQCLIGGTLGVALMNYDLGAVNWRQLGFIFFSWAVTLPAAGLISGLVVLMAINTPRWDMVLGS